MIFAVDIGNTNIVMALMDEQANVIEEKRIETFKQGDVSYFQKEIQRVFDWQDGFLTAAGQKEEVRKIRDTVISSVVPEVTGKIRKAFETLTGKGVLVVTNAVETGITIATDEPDKVGTDLIVGAAAAVMAYSGKIVIFDMGTATTCSVIDEGTYLGTIIIPGVAISNEALVRRASQLPPIEWKAPQHLIGKNTIDSMQSGLIYANAAMVDGLIKRVEDELSSKVTVIATGGIAGLIIPHCERTIIYEPDLLLKGLWWIEQKNMIENQK